MVDILGFINTGAIFGTLLKGMFFVLIGLVGFFIFRNMRRKKLYKYEAEIYERDNLGQMIVTTDRFGILVDKKTNMEMGHLLRAKQKLGVGSFNYQAVRVPGSLGRVNIRRVVRLLRLGGDEYIFLKPIVHNPDGELELAMTREDLDWGINAFISCTQTYNYKSKFADVAPTLMVMGALVVVIVVGVMLTRQFPEMAKALREASSSLASASSNILKAQAIQAGVVP